MLDKLESILSTENEARHIVDDARAQARRIVADAQAAADALMLETAAAARDEAGRAHEAAIASAEAEAADIRTEARSRISALGAEVRVRIPTAIEAALSAMRE